MNNVRRHSVPAQLHDRILKPVKGFRESWNKLGEQTQFYVRTLVSIGDAFLNYRTELLRVIAQMSLGVGALTLIGGTVVIIGFLTTFAGSTISIYAYNSLAGIGVESLTGFLIAYTTVRVGAPVIATVGLAATIGAGATAQLGAMRINEEIDALEVIGVRSLAFLASTRVAAGVMVIIPLYCVADLMAFVGARITTALYGQSSGVYNYYFNTYLNPVDILWSFVIVIVAGTVVMLVHTYYGYTASGGPVGVGEAVGRATRASMAFAVFALLVVSMAIYGPTGNFHLVD
jgi:phospholipid/cholesterol/gamma-HCH transport system permease protein